MVTVRFRYLTACRYQKSVNRQHYGMLHRSRSNRRHRDDSCARIAVLSVCKHISRTYHTSKCHQIICASIAWGRGLHGFRLVATYLLLVLMITLIFIRENYFSLWRMAMCTTSYLRLPSQLKISLPSDRYAKLHCVTDQMHEYDTCVCIRLLAEIEWSQSRRRRSLQSRLQCLTATPPRHTTNVDKG